MEIWDNIILQSPWWLTGIPFIIGLYAYQWIKKPTQHNILVSSTGDWNPKKSWKITILPILPILKILALTSIFVALSRPQKVSDKVKETAEGIDIVLSIDISSSMLYEDFTPNRLEVAKSVATEFVNKRKFDRIGLVTFAGESFSLAPVTTDHNLITDYISTLRDGLVAQGTAIGMGIAT